jgi:3-hydroxyisobutyrate dehydrogenase-like beta-hydroxyacid dehydrogenase
MAKIGFIGAGHTGRPIAQRLVNAGHEVTVYDANKENSMLVEGAEVMENPAQAADGREYLITMLPFSDDTIEVLMEDNGALSAAQPNCVFIDCGTGSPSLTWFIARQVNEDGFEFLDCPVSGGVREAEEGSLLLMGSGKKEVFDKASEIFEVFSAKQHYLGEESGLGQLMQLTLNSMLAAEMVLFSESVNFGEKAGIKKEQIFNVMKDSMLMAPFIKSKVTNLLEEKFDPDFQTYLMDKDLIYINEVAEHVKVAMPLTSISWQYYRSAIADGFEEKDFSSVYEVIKKLSTETKERKKAA